MHNDGDDGGDKSRTKDSITSVFELQPGLSRRNAERVGCL